MKEAVKLILLAVFAAAFVFLGIDLAASGLERVHGPTVSPPPTVIVYEEAGEAQHGEGAEKEAPEEIDPASAALAHPEPLLDGSDGAPKGLLNRATMALGDVLQYLAKGVIHFFADLFSAIVH